MKNIYLIISVLFTLTAAPACSGGDGGDQENPNGGKPPYSTSVFAGQNLVTFGNSITAAENSWAYQTRTRLAFATLYNGAVAGACWYKRERTKDGQTIRTQDYTDPDFAGMSNESNTSIEAFQRIINNCAIVHVQKYLAEHGNRLPDVIVLSYGTNDAYSDATIGSAQAALQADNPDKLDLYTMAGALKWCLVTLQTEFPRAKIYVALPLQARDDAKNSGNLKKMAVIKEICEGLSVPYFDCYNECGITQANQAQYLRDGLHPNEAGKTVHANYIVKKLQEANPQ